jgi:hypothetical protein
MPLLVTVKTIDILRGVEIDGLNLQMFQPVDFAREYLHL